MVNEGVKFDRVMIWNEEGIGVIAINNGSENRLDLDTITQVMTALTIANNDDNIKWVVLTGTGSSFFTVGVPWEVVEPTYQAIRDLVNTVKALLSMITVLTKPLITILNGSALGLGMELALVSDLTIAPPDVYLCYPEGLMGIPMIMGHRVLLNRMPRYEALQALTGARVDVTELVRYGVVHGIERKNLFGDAKAIIKSIAVSQYVRQQLTEDMRRDIGNINGLFMNSLLSVMLDNDKRSEFIKILRNMRMKCVSRYRN
ncbi:enoyl-CoA hydratase/isomerase family protein [Vulcanisaeta thermophila]|uniref:enoyl-CoA hydratase/isomerase family protein n=1 Tax=Vulcanisaeta thermophila TaxID=867917 RepID=UPI000852D27B|nr:enoyl-CoA hydratase/isomerase family protein [Vulcanisaeta thermophila]